MAKQIIKINEKNVAVVDELRRIYSKEQLETERTNVAKRLVDIDELLAVFSV